MISVKVGDMIDPANFRLAKQESLKEILPLEDFLNKSPGSFLDRHFVTKDRLVSVFNDHENSWFRGKILDKYVVLGEQLKLDVLLLDHGLTLKGVQYPEHIRRLPDLFVLPEPFHFEFKLHGEFSLCSNHLLS